MRLKNKLTIVDYGMGNLRSVQKSFSRINIPAIITNDYKIIRQADKIILPGVGHFKKAIENIKHLGIWDILHESVLINETPILGICLGMQLMADYSDEGNIEGFGWFNATVKHFDIKDTVKYKIPHVGWNTVIKTKSSQLMKNIPDDSEFYFVHSYHMVSDSQDDILNITEYEYPFVSAVERKNIFGVQYHPEKSHGAGLTLLKNFMDI